MLQIDTRADPAKARHCGYRALKALDFVLDQPPPSAVVQDMLYPNIAIQFVGWLDQSKTDFGKARSQAIEAVKRALEEHGLAIPDPVTHGHMQQGEGLREPGPTPVPAGSDMPSAEENDVSPEHAVTEMVHEERQDDPDNRDLLDSSRPQE